MYEPLPKYPSCVNEIKKNPEISSLLRKAYKSVGAVDYERYLLDPITDRDNYLMSSNAWVRILIEQDALANPNVGEVLQELGVYNLASTANQKNSSKRFEYAWRMGKWDIINENASTNENINDLAAFETYHYDALKNLHNNDSINVNNMVEKAREAVVNLLKETSVECPQSLYEILHLLERLQQIEDFCNVRFKRVNNETLIQKWKLIDQLPSADFKYDEIKLAQRICLLKESGIVASRSWSPLYLEEIVSNLIMLSSQAKDDRSTIRYIAMLKSLNPTPKNQGKALLYDAILSIKQGDELLGESLLVEATKNTDPFVKTMAYHKMGEMKGSSVAAVPSEIFQNYFLKSISTLENYARNFNRLEDMNQGIFANDDNGKLLKENVVIYQTIAQFYEKEYTNVVNFMKSVTYRQKLENFRRLQDSFKQSYQAQQQQRITSSHEKRAFDTLKKTLAIDKQNLEHVRNERSNYAGQCIKYYIKHCYMSPGSQNLNIFRVISIWLSNEEVS